MLLRLVPLFPFTVDVCHLQPDRGLEFGDLVTTLGKQSFVDGRGPVEIPLRLGLRHGRARALARAQIEVGRGRPHLRRELRILGNSLEKLLEASQNGGRSGLRLRRAGSGTGGEIHQLRLQVTAHRLIHRRQLGRGLRASGTGKLLELLHGLHGLLALLGLDEVSQSGRSGGRGERTLRIRLVAPIEHGPWSIGGMLEQGRHPRVVAILHRHLGASQRRGNGDDGGTIARSHARQSVIDRLRSLCPPTGQRRGRRTGGLVQTRLLLHLPPERSTCPQQHLCPPRRRSRHLRHDLHNPLRLPGLGRGGDGDHGRIGGLRPIWPGPHDRFGGFHAFFLGLIRPGRHRLLLQLLPTGHGDAGCLLAALRTRVTCDEKITQGSRLVQALILIQHVRKPRTALIEALEIVGPRQGHGPPEAGDRLRPFRSQLFFGRVDSGLVLGSLSLLQVGLTRLHRREVRPRRIHSCLERRRTAIEIIRNLFAEFGQQGLRLRAKILVDFGDLHGEPLGIPQERGSLCLLFLGNGRGPLLEQEGRAILHAEPVVVDAIGSERREGQLLQPIIELVVLFVLQPALER